MDRARLIRHIDRSLQNQAEVSLSELTRTQPLNQGHAKLVAYFHLGSERYETKIDEAASEAIHWQIEAGDGAVNRKTAQLPRVVFER